ncbi:lysine transporter LysE [Planktosalinus lacus]|uniref:Lysine transporter LysE n=2 Tax=Planktosalinus lacus TaxID=1526573 RepID=A0A8J2VA39_9FLAO|nr:lysine transporter LysE [Planktosalinus lacus]
MTAAKISIKENRRNALLFSLGVITIVGLQTNIALLFARYLDKHPEVIEMLQQVGLGIFICITIYFLFIAKEKKPATQPIAYKSKRHRFFQGLLLASLNLFPLPYWVYLSITFSSFGWFEFSKPFIAFCVTGSIVGTLTMLIAYAHYFNYAKKKQQEIKLNINYMIGGITALISVITLIKILNDM